MMHGPPPYKCGKDIYAITEKGQTTTTRCRRRCKSFKPSTDNVETVFKDLSYFKSNQILHPNQSNRDDIIFLNKLRTPNSQLIKT